MGWDTAKAGTIAGATPSTTCCTARMACSQTTVANACVHGRKLKAVYCTSSAGTSASCDANCCETDTGKCGGYFSKVCTNPTTHYWDSAKANTVIGSSSPSSACCTAKQTCYGTPSTVCAAGRRKKMQYCATSSTASAACNANCCEPDTTKCRFSGVVCPPNHYVDQAKWGSTATSTNMTATCCTAKASCNLTYTVWQPGSHTVSGSFNFAASGATVAQVIQAVKTTIALHFSSALSETITANNVAVSAFETRRLEELSRRLAGQWAINYDFTVPSTKAAQATNAVNGLGTNTRFAISLTSNLQKQGWACTVGGTTPAPGGACPSVTVTGSIGSVIKTPSNMAPPLSSMTILSGRPALLFLILTACLWK